MVSRDRKRAATLEEAVEELKRDPLHAVRLHVAGVDVARHLAPPRPPLRTQIVATPTLGGLHYRYGFIAVPDPLSTRAAHAACGFFYLLRRTASAARSHRHDVADPVPEEGTGERRHEGDRPDRWVRLVDADDLGLTDAAVGSTDPHPRPEPDLAAVRGRRREHGGCDPRFEVGAASGDGVVVRSQWDGIERRQLVTERLESARRDVVRRGEASTTRDRGLVHTWPLARWIRVVSFSPMTFQSRSILQVLVVGMIAVAPFHVLAQQAADLSVKCKDGSPSKGGKGACSHHGGIAQEAPSKAPASTGSAKALPAPPKVNGAAEGPVKCKDGSMSPHGGRGACSGHGGIDKTPANDNHSIAPVSPPAATHTLAPAPVPAPTTAPGKATARCKDGTTSFSTHHSGTCSSHGGVAQWLDGSK
jgi:hypothetical protein